MSKLIWRHHACENIRHFLLHFYGWYLKKIKHSIRYVAEHGLCSRVKNTIFHLRTWIHVCWLSESEEVYLLSFNLYVILTSNYNKCRSHSCGKQKIWITQNWISGWHVRLNRLFQMPVNLKMIILNLLAPCFKRSVDFIQ